MNTVNARIRDALRRDVALAPLCTLGVGGRARLLTDVTTGSELEAALDEACSRQLPVFYLGEGSNVLFDDAGFDGLIVRNRIRGREQDGFEIRLGGGENLSEVVVWANRLGLQGLERLYGIPGTVAGAVVGNAGAYGQEIGACVGEVEAWVGGRRRRLTPAELELGYRTSTLKANREWFVLRCTLRLRPSRRPLQQISDAILAKRLEKYPTDLRSPGSFFKNVPVGQLSAEALEVIPDSFIHFGKVPAGRLLEAVGANGTRLGDAAFADYHGNLLMNVGQARSSEFLTLAERFSERVREKFRVRLEPEIDIVHSRGRVRRGES